MQATKDCFLTTLIPVPMALFIPYSCFIFCHFVSETDELFNLHAFIVSLDITSRGVTLVCPFPSILCSWNIL